MTHFICHSTDDCDTRDATDGIGQRMQNNIGIAITGQRGGIVKNDSSKYKLLISLAFNEAMTIQAKSSFNLHHL